MQLAGQQPKAPQLPSKIQGFVLPAPEKPTCSSALVHPWQIGSWTNTALNPFDNINLLGKEASDIRWCGQKRTDKQGQAQVEVTPCSDCPNGYKVGLADSGPLMCRDPPVPDQKGMCTECRQSVLQPWVVGTCDACITYGVNPENGTCACNEF